MSDKYTCKACYKKFVATRNSKCPQCGTKVENKASNPVTKSQDVSWAEEDYLDPIPTIEDLEYEVDKAKRGVRSLAIAFIVLIFSSLVGGALFTIGTISQATCALQNQNCSSANQGIGLAVISIGLLVSVALSASALVSAKR
jgi:DNA-directed RNA polymerase subunit RPC12/RpoP